MLQCWNGGLGRWRKEEDDCITVLADDQMFTWSEMSGGRVQSRRGDLSWPGSGFLDARPLLAEADVEVSGSAEFLGRPAHLVRVTPLPFEHPWITPGRAPRGADARELVVDAKHGVVLRDEALIHDAPWQVAELTEVDFDTPLAPELFAFEGPDGSEPVPSPDNHRIRPVPSLGVLAAEIGFTVLVPAHVRTLSGPSLRIYDYDDGRAKAHLSYHVYCDGQRVANFEIDEWTGFPPDPLPAAPDWRHDDGLWIRGTTVMLERDGIWVMLEVLPTYQLGSSASALTPAPAPAPVSVEELAAYARTLVPLPSGPPPLAPVSGPDTAKPA